MTAKVANNQYTISSISGATNIEVKFEAVTHTLDIIAKGNGTAVYSGTQNVTIMVTQNPSSTESRETMITVKNVTGTIERKVTVTQSANTELTDYKVSTNELSADAPAGTVQFNIIGNAQWTISSNANWATPNVTYGEGNASITVSLTDNTSEEAREAIITISSNTKSETVTIRQGAGTKPTITSMNVNYDGKTSAEVTFTYSSMFPVTEYGVCYNTTGQPTINDVRLQLMMYASRSLAMLPKARLLYR